VAKGRIRELADEKARAARARQRFESRNKRLDDEQRVRDSELRMQKDSAQKAGPAAIDEILKRNQQNDDER
jgi:Na+-translocating ferredoxin:NAD+ oxidoreductase RnfC subunit